MNKRDNVIFVVVIEIKVLIELYYNQPRSTKIPPFYLKNKHPCSNNIIFLIIRLKRLILMVNPFSRRICKSFCVLLLAIVIYTLHLSKLIWGKKEETKKDYEDF